jgi:hypothetical protein
MPKGLATRGVHSKGKKPQNKGKGSHNKGKGSHNKGSHVTHHRSKQASHGTQRKKGNSTGLVGRAALIAAALASGAAASHEAAPSASVAPLFINPKLALPMPTLAPLASSIKQIMAAKQRPSQSMRPVVSMRPKLNATPAAVAAPIYTHTITPSFSATSAPVVRVEIPKYARENCMTSGGCAIQPEDFCGALYGRSSNLVSIETLTNGEKLCKPIYTTEELIAQHELLVSEVEKLFRQHNFKENDPILDRLALLSYDDQYSVLKERNHTLMDEAITKRLNILDIKNLYLITFGIEQNSMIEFIEYLNQTHVDAIIRELNAHGIKISDETYRADPNNQVKLQSFIRDHKDMLIDYINPILLRYNFPLLSVEPASASASASAAPSPVPSFSASASAAPSPADTSRIMYLYPKAAIGIAALSAAGLAAYLHQKRRQKDAALALRRLLDQRTARTRLSGL